MRWACARYEGYAQDVYGTWKGHADNIAILHTGVHHERIEKRAFHCSDCQGQPRASGTGALTCRGSTPATPPHPEPSRRTGIIYIMGLGGPWCPGTCTVHGVPCTALGPRVGRGVAGGRP